MIKLRVFISDGKYEDLLEIDAKDLPTAIKRAKVLVSSEYPGYKIQAMRKK